jgi:4-amino-4-deoxy-L-arabinose transferase-like glycosyltransferase
MQATIAFVLGIVLSAVILKFSSRKPVDSSRPTLVGWSAFAIGLATLASFLLGALVLSILCATAAMILAIEALRRKDYHWPVWVGLAAGIAPAVFWIAFLFGNLLDFFQ